MTGKALIFGQDNPGDTRRHTWTIVSGFPGEDEARAYNSLVGGGAVKNANAEIQRKGILIPDSVDYRDKLKAEGLESEFEAALQKLRDDRAERAAQEAAEQERRRQEREEVKRQRAIDERARELAEQEREAARQRLVAKAAQQIDGEK